MRKNFLKVVVLAVFVLSLTQLVLPALAADVTTCQAAIDTTLNDLNGVTIGGGNPERTRASLESKLTGASTKLDEGKYADALQKLTDFRNQVLSLANAPKPKLSQEDASLLLADVDAAIGCVQTLIDGS